MLKHFTDEEIMIEVANGKLNKLAVLFDRHHIRIYNFFKKMTQNKMLSEDLTQEVFIKVLKYRTSYKKGNFTSWIYTIARNIFSDYYQKQKKERTNIAIENIKSSDEVIINDNEDEIKHLQISLQKLNPSERELIIMHKIQGIKYKQLAEITGSSENALKVKIHRILKKLKDIYFQSEK